MGLEVVNVGAVPMNLYADIVSCAMNKIFAVPFVGDVFARDIVHVASPYFSSTGKFFLQILHCYISCPFNDFENLLIFGGIFSPANATQVMSE